MMRPNAFGNSQHKKNLMFNITVLYCFVKHHRHPASQRVMNAIRKPTSTESSATRTNYAWTWLQLVHSALSVPYHPSTKTWSRGVASTTASATPPSITTSFGSPKSVSPSSCSSRWGATLQHSHGPPGTPRGTTSFHSTKPTSQPPTVFVETQGHHRVFLAVLPRLQFMKSKRMVPRCPWQYCLDPPFRWSGSCFHSPTWTQLP